MIRRRATSGCHGRLAGDKAAALTENADALHETIIDTEVVDQIQEIVGLVVRVLGPEVIGTYLHGSSVLGGLKPASVWTSSSSPAGA